jgi:glutamate-1-semialdehyde 2,1-aminomutase
VRHRVGLDDDDSHGDRAGAHDVGPPLLFHELLDRGVYVAPRGFIALSLAVTDTDVEEFLRALDGALTAMR